MNNKHLIILMGFFCCCSVANAQYVNIADTGFRSCLQLRYPSCFNAARQLDTVCAANYPDSTFQLLTGDWAWWNIESVDGVQYFKKIKYLTLYDGYNVQIPKFPPSVQYLDLYFINAALPPFPDSVAELTIAYNDSLRVLPALPSRLTSFRVSSCPLLSALPSLPPGLQRLECYLDSLITLPPLPPSLTVLYAYDNKISSLPPFPSTLRTISLSYNKLTSLPPIPSSATYLNVSGNEINSIVFPSPSALSYIDISKNKLTSLPPVPPTVTALNCRNNLLTTLQQLSPSSLLRVYCDHNSLTTLPALPSTINNLDCRYNNLSSLPFLPTGLDTLLCTHNTVLATLPLLPDSLKQLYIDTTAIICLPILPKKLRSLKLDTSDVKCIPNTNYGMYVNGRSNFPLCNATNNPHHCTAFPFISGHMFFDLNNNNVRDGNEPYRERGKINLSNGGYTFTNDSGYYQVTTDTVGPFTVTPTPHPFFSILPTYKAFNFTGYDTAVSQDFAFHTLTTKDSVAVTVTVAQTRVRPGGPLTYVIAYENDGSTILSPVAARLTFDSSKLVYDSASNGGVTRTGNVLTLNIASLPLGAYGKLNTYLHVKTTASLGDTVTAYTTVTGGSTISMDSARTGIRLAFDPNDKSATPTLTQSQVNAGTYIDYTIRFQNTGTDTAFDVVITDTLPLQVQANTLEVIGSSHLTIATLNGNAVTFEMRNIMLPDSNVNEVRSHGYVRFRVRPITTLVAGNIVPNKASIYFDYNAAVVTNTAVTQVRSESVMPLHLLGFSATRDGKVNKLHWTASSEVNVDHFEVERSDDGREWVKVKSERSKGDESVVNSYSWIDEMPLRDVNYYRLKMVDRDGSLTYSPVRVVKTGAQLIVSVQPNPVRDKLRVKVVSAISGTMQVDVISQDGKSMMIWQWQVSEGSTLQSMNTSTLPKGTYWLRIMIDGAEQTVVKFEKI